MFASPRECHCPEYIERCAHHAGTKLFLTDRQHPTVTDQLLLSLPRYLMGCDEPTPRLISYRYTGDDHAVALAAFYAAEGELLGRDE